MTQSVLIAGAGPVGLTLAAELARYRVPLRIVDMAPARTDKSKAIAIWARTLELLDRGGSAAPFVEAGLQASAAHILSGHRSIARVAFTDLESPFRFGLLLPQSETERLLEERLTALGVTVERGTTLQGFAATETGVTCTLSHADGSTETVETVWLAGCDGAHSTVRKALGLTFEGDTLPQSFVLADAHVAGLPLPADEIAIFWHRDGFLLFFPIAPGRYRLIADVGSEPRHDSALAEVQAIVDGRGPGGVTVSDPIWLAGFTINERMVPQYCAGRVFVAGDAAHIHSPAGGQGMNTGMHDAVNLAWKLALVCHGEAGSGLLDSYSAERVPVARRVLADAGRMTRAAMLASPAAQEIRNAVVHGLLGFGPLRDAMADRLSELTIGYPDSPLNAGTAGGLAHPAPGARVEGAAPFGAGDRPRFALLAEDTAEARSFLAGHAGLVEPEPRAPLAAGAVGLVRPDGYLAAVARADGWDVLGRCLSAIAAGGKAAIPG